MESPGASASQRSSDNGKATHIFTELRSHDDLLLPVRGSKRLKYTCITCSRQYIALGSSHGGLYIFQRDTLKYLQQIGNKEGLTKALFSPNENVIGMATSGGAVIAWKLNITSRQKAERLVAAQAHRNHRITSLCWDGAGLRLFSGDERGRITVTNTDSSKPSGIFKFQSELVVDVDSSVVQMDFAEERLLISTMTRCYMCDPKKQLSFPIGTKLRDGAYGACFLNKSGSERPSIFCARPGSRMWEANTLCQVLNTHQFKQLLATPPLPVVGKGREATFPSEDTKHPPQSLAFPILHPLGNHFLVTWTERGVFVFDPVNVNVVFWTSDISGLVDVSVSKSSLYCLHQDGHVHKYTLQNIARCAASLYQQSLLVQCSRLVLRFQTQFQRSRARHHMPSRVLHELAKRVAAEDSLLGCDVEELAVAVENRMLDVASTVSSRRSSFDSYDEMRQQSGIYVVRKRLDSECSDDLPLGYDAHMDQIQGNMELTEKTSHDTIQETSPTKAETDSKEATPTEHISLEVGVSFHVEDPKDEVMLQENSLGELTREVVWSRDSTSGNLSGQLEDKEEVLVVKEIGMPEENSPPGDGLTVKQIDQSGARISGFDERRDQLVKQDADSLGVPVEQIDVSRDEVDILGGIGDATLSVNDSQRTSGSGHLDGIESVIGSNREKIHSVENEQTREEKVLQDQDAEADVVESAGGGQILVEDSSMKEEMLSTPNQDAIRAKDDYDTPQFAVQLDGKSGLLMMTDFADNQTPRQSDHVADDVLPVEEKGTTGDITESIEVPVDDGVPEEHSESFSLGKDFDEVEETMQEELMVGGMDSAEQLVTKDGGATDECQLVGINEINQRKTMTNTLENDHSLEGSITSTSIVQLELSEVQTDIEMALENIQLIEDVVNVGERTGHEIHKQEVKENTEDLTNQKCNIGFEEEDAVETKEQINDANNTVLSDLCLVVKKEEEVKDETWREECSILELTKETSGEESHSTQQNGPLIKEGIMKVLTRAVNLITDNDESTPVDVSGFGLDVSGFGISPPEESIHYPSSQVEESNSFDQSASAHQTPFEDAVTPGLGEDLAGFVKVSHLPVSNNASDPLRALQNDEERVRMLTTDSVVDDTRDAILERRREDGDVLKQEERKKIVSDGSSSNEAFNQCNPTSINPLTSHDHNANQEKPVEHPEEDCSSLPNSSPSSNISTLDDSNTSSSSLDKLKDMSQLSEQSTPSASSSSENLEIVIEDDLEVAEGDAQFPDAETELIQAVTGSQYVQRQTEFTRDRSQSLEKLNEESSGGKSPSATTKRKKTKSRVIDITATVSRKPSPLQAMTPGSVLYRPTSLPDLSPQSSSQPRSLQRTPSSTTPSPALSPKKEARKQFPVSSALPSSNLIMAATSGLPHSSGLIETQQILLNSTTQINLKSVKDSLTSKLSKTKTFLQSIGDSNPLSPKDGEHSFPPMQRRPSPASSPISGSPTHRKGTSPSVPRREIPHQQSTGSPHPSPVTSPLHRPRPPGERDFPHGLEEETEEEQIDARHSEDLIEATKSAVPALHDRQTRYNTNALRDVLQPWVQKLEQSYRWCHSEGIIPWSKGHHLPVTVREDVGRLATLCFSLDIYANEEGHGNGEGEMEQETRSKIETGGDDCSDTSKLDGCRAAFIKRHFNILDRQRIIEVLRHKQSCHALRTLVQCEGDAAKNTNISDALDNGDVQEAFDLLLRADLSSSNLPLYLCFLQRLCGLDSGRALDVIISDYPSIGPWHAYHILQDQTQSKCLILDYVESFLLTHPFAQRKKFIEQVMAMKPLVLSLAEAAVTFDPPSFSELFCDCGKLPK
ncbi:uncharacterized protein LOC100890358 [Strongylocentrotus purpuratus]|uniref:Uncharacterized protein n=1 Tax=Strongylocentrotus purpuratus TaxID=7668 RepID=A0A7M7T0D8_STRPU|nr:uncharacterized protein LOC100890358 [Strongylocentrotus purpuratus]